MQYIAADGTPKLLGCGRATRIDCAQGYIYRISAPGLSLRAHDLSPGISFGWSTLRLFYPAADGSTNSRPVAIQTTLAGVDLAPWHVVLGSERSFGIPFPRTGVDVLQLVSYSARNPNATIIKRKETK